MRWRCPRGLEVCSLWGVAAQVIMRTMHENNPLLPHVLSVNLEGQHGTLLAGTIIGNLISTLVASN